MTQARGVNPRGVNPQLSPRSPRYPQGLGLGAGGTLIPTSGTQAGSPTGVRAGGGLVVADPGAQADAMASWLLSVQNQLASTSQQAATQAPGLSKIAQLASSDLFYWNQATGGNNATGWSLNQLNAVIGDFSLLRYQANLAIPILSAVGGQVAWIPNFKTIGGMLSDYGAAKRQVAASNATIASLQGQVNNLTGQVAQLKAQLKAANAAAAAAASVCVKR